MLPGRDVLAVRRPRWTVQQPELFFGYLLRLRTVSVHDPDVVAPCTVTGECDALSIGAVARLHIPGDAARERLGFAPSDGHGVDIAEQIKGDLVSLWTHIQV